MFDNAVLTRSASAQPNLFRDLQALSWSHGFHARSVASLPRLPHPGSPPTANPGAARRPPERRSHDPVRHGLTHRHWTKDARRHPRRDPRPRDRRARVEARRGPSPRNRRARTGNPGGPRPGNRLRPLRALHGRTFKRLREHGALWNRSGRRARRRYPRTRTGAGMHHPAPARLHHHSWPWPNPSHAVCVPALASPSPQPRVSSSWAQAPSASSTARSLPPRARPSWRAGDPRAWIPRSPSARVP